MNLPRLGRGRRRRLLLRLVGSGALQAATVVGAMYGIRAVIDAPGQGDALAIRAAAVGVVVAAAMAALRWRERVDGEALAQSYVFRVRTRLLHKLERLEPGALVGRGHGGLLLRFAGDLTAIGQWVGRGIPRAVTACLIAAAALTAVAGFHWLLAATFAIGIAVAAAAAAWRKPRLDGAVATLRTARARLVTRINRTLNELPLLDEAGALEAETARLARRARVVRDAAIARAREAAALDAIAEAGAYAIPVAVVCTALATRGAGTVTQGELVAVLGVAVLVSTPLRDGARAFDWWRRARQARAKLLEFLAQPERGVIAGSVVAIATADTGRGGAR